MKEKRNKFILSKQPKKFVVGIIGHKLRNKNLKYCVKFKNQYNQVTKVIHYGTSGEVKEIISYGFYQNKKIKNKKSYLWNNKKIVLIIEKEYFINRNIKDDKVIKYNFKSNTQIITNSRYNRNGNTITHEIIYKDLKGRIAKTISYVYNKHGQLSSNKAGNAFKYVSKFNDQNKIECIFKYLYDHKGDLHKYNTKLFKKDEHKHNCIHISNIN